MNSSSSIGECSSNNNKNECVKIAESEDEESYGYESDFLLDSPCGYDDDDERGKVGLGSIDQNVDDGAVSASKRMNIKDEEKSNEDDVVSGATIGDDKYETPTGLLQSMEEKLTEVCDSDEQHPLILEMSRECGVELSEFLMALSRKTIKLTTQPPKLLRTNRYQQNSITKPLQSCESLLSNQMKQNIRMLNERCSKYGNMQTIPMAYYLARMVCYLNKFFGHINITQICSIGIYAVVSAIILLIRLCEKGSEIGFSLTSRNIHRLLMTSILVSARQLCRVQRQQTQQQNQQLLKMDHKVWMKVVGIESELEMVELEKMFIDCFDKSELSVSHDLVYKLTISTEADIEMQRYFDGDSDLDSDDDEEDDEEEEDDDDEDGDEDEYDNEYDEDENARIDELLGSDVLS